MKNQRSTNDAKVDLRLNCVEVLLHKIIFNKNKDMERLLQFVDQDNPLLRLDCVDLAIRCSDGGSTVESAIKEAELIYKFVTKTA